MIRTEIVPLEAFVAHPSNPKAHAIDDLILSIERFGFVEPVVRDGRTGYLLSGHGRVEALRRMKIAGKPPPKGIDVLSCSASIEGLTWGVPAVAGFSTADDEEALALLVALNQLTTLGGWDQVALERILRGANSTDLRGLGFTERDVAQLARSRPLPASAVAPIVVGPEVAALVEYVVCPKCAHRFPR